MKNKKKRYFVTGLLIILPVLITLYLVVSLFTFFDNILGRYVSIWTMEKFGFKVPGLGLLVFMIVIFATGFFATNFIGRTLLTYLEKFWIKFPVVRSIYPAVKRITTFLFGSRIDGKFDKVVLVEYPRKGIYTLAFATKESYEGIRKRTGRDLVNILIPSVPSPLTGFLIMVPRREVIFLDMGVDDAVKIIVSGGVLDPKDLVQ